MLREYDMSCALTLLACTCLAAMLCLRDAACLDAHFGSRSPYERGSRGSGDPLESFLSVSDAAPHGLIEIKNLLASLIVVFALGTHRKRRWHRSEES